MRRRICIVSSGCLSTGPRVVKEADALSEAGHDVHVVVLHWMAGQHESDTRLAHDKPWSWSAARWDGARGRRAPLVLAGKLLRGGARASERVWRGALPQALGLSDHVPPLLLAAAKHDAELYIAHNLPALPVAALLARVRGAHLAFDAEDDHYAELDHATQASPRGLRTDAIMRRYLPRCAHVTAASEGMAEALAQRCGIAMPTAVHNVFPWALRERLDGRTLDRGAERLSLHWYSQTIGLDRGIQDAIRALGALPDGVALHLRGELPADVEQTLRALAREVGVEAQLRFHAPVHPDELLSRATEHDVGLALEQPVSDNRMQTVTNKLFFFLLAGLAVAATNTPGQLRVMAQAPGVGFTYAPGDHASLAAGLRRNLDEPAALAAAKTAALDAARTRWCWERERERLVAAVERGLG